ncbi:hypothetical protein CIB93_36480 [Streptomyces sp. WZ.A104]|uniref:hypothetical protein n=1 Tax=unclassified Streptomyces TaxID=2593676 RepID=UPI0009349631|nr:MULTISPECIES: hypothetical protein [unclassified Streptomyces]PCG81236.1 hypothetical protein CIB93_36480 [Streptomyces sp. WZ.A104]
MTFQSSADPQADLLARAAAGDRTAQAAFAAGRAARIRARHLLTASGRAAAYRMIRRNPEGGADR